MNLRIKTNINECETTHQFIIHLTPEQADCILRDLPETPYYDSTNILRNLLTLALAQAPSVEEKETN